MENQETRIRFNSVQEEINGYLEKINYDLGFYFWKYYIYSAFWNYVSTPLNLAITVMTALTTGQLAGQSFLTKETTTALGLATLIISIFNTFFRPAQQLNENTERRKVWERWGTEFEKIYYDKPNSEEEKKPFLESLQKLFNSLNEEKKKNTNNFLIDLIFLLAKGCCIKQNIYWIPYLKI